MLWYLCYMFMSFIAGVWLSAFNSVANPFVYALLMPTYRKCVIRTFFPCIMKKKTDTTERSWEKQRICQTQCSLTFYFTLLYFHSLTLFMKQINTRNMYSLLCKKSRSEEFHFGDSLMLWWDPPLPSALPHLAPCQPPCPHPHLALMPPPHQISSPKVPSTQKRNLSFSKFWVFQCLFQSHLAWIQSHHHVLPYMWK